jgi:hypothetical protein
VRTEKAEPDVGRTTPRTRRRIGRGADASAVLVVVGAAVGVGLLAFGITASALGADWAGFAVTWGFLVSVWTFAFWVRAGRRHVNPFRGSQGSGRSGWLGAATATDEGLVLPGSPPGQGCDLLVGPGGLTVQAGWSSATLAWHQFRVWPGPDPGLGTPSTRRGSSWSIAPFGTEEPVGVAVEVTGSCSDDTALVRRQRRTWTDRLIRRRNGRDRVPVVTRWSVDARLDQERDTLATLCQLLAQRPELRPRLGEPRRVGRLAHDLATATPGEVRDLDPLGRRRFEVVNALKRLGYVHRYGGRPLPEAPLPPRSQVVDRVAAELHRSPYTRDLFIDPELIRQLVDERYFVEPWPFRALLD